MAKIKRLYWTAKSNHMRLLVKCVHNIALHCTANMHGGWLKPPAVHRPAYSFTRTFISPVPFRRNELSAKGASSVHLLIIMHISSLTLSYFMEDMASIWDEAPEEIQHSESWVIMLLPYTESVGNVTQVSSRFLTWQAGLSPWGRGETTALVFVSANHKQLKTLGKHVVLVQLRK